MNEFFIYLMQSALCLSALYLIYWFFLRKDTFFAANRYYLISSIILSFLLPLFKVPFFYDNPELTYVAVMEAVTITAQKVETGIANNLNFYQSAFIVYLTGAIIFFIRFVFQLLQLVFMIRKFGVKKIDGLNIVTLESKYSPFSYFNYIFLNEACLKDENLKEIIDHEKIHIQQKHSFDLVLIEFLTIIQWFNPFIWLYKNSIKGIHEYLADAGLLASGLNKTNYQHLLLNHAIGLQINNLTNNFNQSLIKKRFIMMTKLQSKRIARLKILLVIPVMTILVTVFVVSCQKKDVIKEIMSSDKLPVSEVKQSESEIKEDRVFAVVEKMPRFPGGDRARMPFLSSSIKYPAEARMGGIQGVVYLTFIVEKDGSINDVRIMRGIGGGCDQEEIRVVSSMPNWIPGKQRGQNVRVQFNLPIRFTLDNGNISQNNGSNPTKIKYTVVEEMPEFIGGIKTLKEFVSENLIYPEEARKNNTKGRVFVNFLAEKDGTISNVKIL